MRQLTKINHKQSGMHQQSALEAQHPAVSICCKGQTHQDKQSLKILLLECCIPKFRHLLCYYKFNQVFLSLNSPNNLMFSSVLSYKTQQCHGTDSSYATVWLTDIHFQSRGPISPVKSCWIWLVKCMLRCNSRFRLLLWLIDGTFQFLLQLLHTADRCCIFARRLLV